MRLKVQKVFFYAVVTKKHQTAVYALYSTMGLDALGALVYIMQRKWCGHDKPSNRVGQGQV